MNDSKQWFEQIDGALAEVSRGKPTLTRVKPCLVAIAATLEASGNADARRLAEHIHTCILQLSAPKLQAVLDDVRSRWESTKASVVLQLTDVSHDTPSNVQGGPPSALDDELAVLASDAEMAGMFVA